MTRSLPAPVRSRVLATALLASLLAVLPFTSGCVWASTTTRTVNVSSGAAGPASPATVDRGRRTGTVVVGPARITSFRPESTSVAVDIETLDFKGVFEEIGEDGTLWYQHVQTLANPYFEGRVNGSAGTRRAREYIEFFFRIYGLEPAFPAGLDESGDADDTRAMAWTSYRQPFEFQTRGRLTVTVEAEHASINDEELTSGEDFVVLGNSATAEVAGPVTFVGYGIAEGVDGYSSFGPDTDLSGRVALLLRYEPLDNEGASRWSDARFSRHAGLAYKMGAVTDRGAAGIMLVTPPECRDAAAGLASIEDSTRFGRSRDIPVVQITPAVAERILAAGDPEGRDLLAWRRWADTASGGDGTIHDLSDSIQVRFGAEVDRQRVRDTLDAANVGAVLRGRGALADEWLVIGGHYDHNGYGMFGTTPGSAPLFPGADDNASGTAAVLVLARRLSEEYAGADAAPDLRSVLFMAFDAEERGLHGSRHFTRNPTIELERTTAVINMDMIGRLRSDSLSVLGVGSAEGLEEILRPHFESSGLTVAISLAGSGRSDEVSFQRSGVPGLHFFTGMHDEYTSPRDKAYTVNPVGAAKIIDLIDGIAMDLASRSERLVAKTPGPTRGEDRGYAPVRLGVRPGMSDDLETGILVDGVSSGTSAEEGGLLPGDVMLLWDGVELDGMRTLVDMLRGHKPGDTVLITVHRDGEQIVLPVTLKASGG